MSANFLYVSQVIKLPSKHSLCVTIKISSEQQCFEIIKNNAVMKCISIQYFNSHCEWDRHIAEDLMLVKSVAPVQVTFIPESESEIRVSGWLAKPD